MKNTIKYILTFVIGVLIINVAGGFMSELNPDIGGFLTIILAILLFVIAFGAPYLLLGFIFDSNPSIEKGIETNGHYFAKKEGYKKDGGYYNLTLLLIFNNKGYVHLIIEDENFVLSNYDEKNLVENVKDIEANDNDHESVTKFDLVGNKLTMKFFNNVEYNWSEKQLDEKGEEYVTIKGIDNLNEKYYYYLEGQVEKNRIRLNFSQSYLDYQSRDFVVDEIMPDINFEFKPIN